MGTSQNDHLTIGFLMENLETSAAYTSIIASGIAAAAERHDVNLLVIPGEHLSHPPGRDQFLAQRKLLFDLASTESMDGLIILGALGNFGPPEELADFHKHYHPLPTVSLGTPIQGVTSIIVDNESGLRNAISHLIEEHGRKRIAFIRGPETAQDAQTRYRVYTQTLAEHGLPLDTELIAMGTFLASSGAEAIRSLLDDRQASFDAVVAANDLMALGAMDELQARNILVPDQVAVVGFDDDGNSQVSFPALTTVRQPMMGLGEQAVTTLLEKIAGKAVPEVVTLPTEAVIRQSCGCRDPLVKQAGSYDTKRRSKASESQTALAIHAMQGAINSDGLPSGWAQELIGSFQAELEVRSTTTFLNTLDNLLRQAVKAKDAKIGQWQGVISALSQFLYPTLKTNEELLKAEAIWHQARVSIQEIARKSQGRVYIQQLEQQAMFLTVSQTIATTIQLDRLIDVAARELPRLGIQCCYLALYEGLNPKEGLPEHSRMMLAYHTASPRTLIEPGGTPFKTLSLAPAGLLPENRFTLVIEPLFFQDQQFGFAIFDMSLDGAFYEQLRGQISSALHSSRLVGRVEERAVQIQTAADVSRASSSIMDVDVLVQQAVELIWKRFNLYYVGLFLVDQTGVWSGEPNHWIVLRAGSGNEGRMLLDREYKLELGSDSLVGWCIAKQQARIALDVGPDAVHFDNLLLPETRSEAVLPLISHGKVIGALTIQSARPAAFTSEDIIVLQTMADQLSNAIENANLYGQAQKRAAELNKARDTAEKAREEAEAEKKTAEIAREDAEKARKESEDANRNLAAQVWHTKGQALLNERMRGEQDIPTLADHVIEQLCEYLSALVGALYTLEGTQVKLAGAYAYQRKNLIKQFELGEGLVGQAAKSRRTIHVQVPDDYAKITSASLGEIMPRHVIFVPLVYDDRVVGVVEMGALTQFQSEQLEFLSKSLESVSIAFMTAQARTQVNQLFAQTRQQAEELQAQEEELRATNEELEAQTESLRASETRLKQNQAALEAANVDLEEKTQILQEKQDALDRQNQILRDAQQELERKADELSLASKYKSEFLANMSHELRTPLNSMLILAGMLSKNEEGNLTADQMESAQVIHAGGTDLLNLINEILDLAKVEAGKMEFHFAPMAWRTLIQRMSAQFDPLAERKGVKFITSIASDLPNTIITDDQRLAQVIKNLLSNAFKFTDTGSVSLAVHRPDVDSGHSPTDFVAVSVTDTGIGMTPDQQKVVFEAFQQADGSTSRQYGGTGLGLAITREMSLRLGGQVVLQSEHGKGSTFTIYLPLQKQPDLVETPKAAPLPAPKKAAPALPKPSKAGSIPDDRDAFQGSDRILLIVEDDPRFAQVVFDYAHKKSFKCLIAGDGETALELLKRYKPHAMVLDLGLPGMSGWEVLDAVTDNPDTRHIPIHIISAHDEDMSAFQRGAMSFLTKPVSQEDLEGTLDKIEQFITSRIKSLLLVEDDDVLRMSVRKLIEGSDVAITETSNGQAALAALAAHQFDCMILDLSLPDMSGFELLSRLHNNNKFSKCPVIVYTGRALSEEENRELLKYAESVIVKGAKSPERLLDETALFLHRVIADLPEEKQRTIRKLHSQESVLEGKIVLVVDDDTRNAFALSKLLADKGVKVKIAPSAVKALDMLDHSPDANLVLTDIMMPGMDGYDFMRALRAQPRFKKLPIIALTAKAMKGDREKCIEAGASDYLSKPIDPDRLFSMLRVWLSRE